MTQYEKSAIQSFLAINSLKLFTFNNCIPKPYFLRDDMRKCPHLQSSRLQKFIDGLPATRTALEKLIWPIALARRNIILCAERRSEGTALISSFVFPAIVISYKETKVHRGPTVLILSSSSYASEEIIDLVKKYGDKLDVSSFYAKDEIIRTEIEILLATPKVLMMALLDDKTTLKDCQLIIVDQIDEILGKGDYGFLDNIFRSMDHEPQIIIYSSTWPLDVRVFLEAQFPEKISSYIRIVSGKADQTKTALNNGSHFVHTCASSDKMKMLCQILTPLFTKDAERVHKRILVFAKPDQDHIDEIQSYLLAKGFPTLKANVDTDSSENRRVYEQFQDFSQMKILVAYSGFKYLYKIRALKYVIVYDFSSFEAGAEAEYLYQISRVGQISTEMGISHLLYTEKDLPRARELIDILGALNQRVDSVLHSDLIKLAVKQNDDLNRKRLTQFNSPPEITEFDYSDPKKYTRLINTSKIEQQPIEIHAIASTSTSVSRKVAVPKPVSANLSKAQSQILHFFQDMNSISQMAATDKTTFASAMQKVLPSLLQTNNKAAGPSQTMVKENITHYVEVLIHEDKLRTLVNLLQRMQAHCSAKNDSTKIVIFTSPGNTDPVGDFLYEQFPPELNKLTVTVVPSTASESFTELLLATFSKTKNEILVLSDNTCQDQKLGFSDLNVVINYDYPKGKSALQVFLNRIANITSNTTDGISITFFTLENHLEDHAYASNLIDHLIQSNQIINPLFKAFPIFDSSLSVTEKVNRISSTRPAITVGNLKSFYSSLDSNPGVQRSVQPDVKKYVSITECSHIPQYVEVLESADKANELAKFLLFILSKNTLYSNIKMLLFANTKEITYLSTFLPATLNQSLIMPIPMLQIANDAPEAKRSEILNSFQHGILFVSPTNFADKKDRLGIDGVNIVFNYTLDNGQNVFATHYINRISNLDKYAGLFAISFVTIKTIGVLEPIIYLLKRMNQSVNPLLVLLQKIISLSNDKNKKSAKHKDLLRDLQKEISTRHTITDGNLAAVYIFIELKAPKHKSVPQFVPAFKITDGDAKNYSHIPHFVEVVTEAEKSLVFRNFINKLFGEMSSLKVLIFAKNAGKLTQLLIDSVSKKIVVQTLGQFRVPREVIINSFKCGILLVPFSEVEDNNHDLEIEGVNFLINYDSCRDRKSTIAFKNLVNLKSDGFSISFFSPHDVFLAYKFIQELELIKQPINPLLTYMNDFLNKNRNIPPERVFEKIDEYIDSKPPIKEGNIMAFYEFLKIHTPSYLLTSPVMDIANLVQFYFAGKLVHTKVPSPNDCAHIKQFVEVMKNVEKPEVLLHLILNISKDRVTFPKFKMLIFASQAHVHDLCLYLPLGLEGLRQPPVVAQMPCDATPSAQTAVLKSFRHGILLVATSDFKQKEENLGIDDLNFVINYDVDGHHTKATTYLERISNLKDSIMMHAFAITFVSEKNFKHVDILIDLLKAMKQVVNPLLINIKTLLLKLKSLQTTKIKRAELLRSEITMRNTIEDGNLVAFHNYLNSSSASMTSKMEYSYFPKTVVERTKSSAPTVDADSFDAIEAILSEFNIDDEIEKSNETHSVNSSASSEDEQAATIETKNDEFDIEPAKPFEKKLILGSKTGEPKPEPIATINEESVVRFHKLNVHHYVELLSDADKPETLFNIISDILNEKAKASTLKMIVFTNDAQQLWTFLSKKSITACSLFCIYFMQPFNDRAEVFKKFDAKQGILIVSLPTGVERNQNFKLRGVNFIVNYDYPDYKEQERNSKDVYIYRMANMDLQTNNSILDGFVLSFFTANNLVYANELVDLLEFLGQTINPSLNYIKHIQSTLSAATALEKTRLYINVKPKMLEGNVMALYKKLGIKISTSFYSINGSDPGLNDVNRKLKQVLQKRAGLTDQNVLKNYQYVEIMQNDHKLQTLSSFIVKILKEYVHIANVKMIIFAEDSRIDYITERVTHFVSQTAIDHKVYGISTTLKHESLKDVLNSYRNAKNHTLIVSDDVCEDQNLDAHGVNFVISYDYPEDGEGDENKSAVRYMNRISNLESAGVAITFLTPETIHHVSMLCYILKEMNQIINPFLLVMESDNNDAKHITMQIAITARSTTTVGNIKSLYNDLHSKSSSSSASPVQIEKKISKIQCIEVLSSEIEKEKKDKLWELLMSIFAFDCYKNIKIVFFANELQEDLHLTVDDFFERNGKSVRKSFPGFNVFTAVDQESDELKRNLKMFFQQQNGLLVTNVYLSKLEIKNADFVIFYDFPFKRQIYSESVQAIQSSNSNNTCFVTFLSPSDQQLAEFLVHFLENSNQPINPLMYHLQHDNFLTAADIKESLTNDRSGTFGSIIHLLKLGKTHAKSSSSSVHSITPYRSYSQFSGKLPICIVRWLENGSYKDPGLIQANCWPVTVAKTNLLAITPVGEERTLTLVLSALIWIVQAKTERKNVMIYTPTIESVVRIRTIVGFVYDILAKNEVPINFTSLLLVEQPVYASKEMNPQRLLFLQNCEYVIFDAFDEMIQLGFVDKCTDTLETIRGGALFADDVCLHIFSAEFSAYEKLVSTMFLKNHHVFNIADVKQMPPTKIRHGFSNVRQYVAPNVKSQTPKLLLELVKEILRVDKTKNYTIVIYTQEEYTLAAFNNMRPQITAPVFLWRNLENDHQENVFWNDLNSYDKSVLFTSDATSNMKVQNVKYVINMCLPNSKFSGFDYLQRMQLIESNDGSIITFFDHKYLNNDVSFLPVLEHIRHPSHPILVALLKFSHKQKVYYDQLETLKSGQLAPIGDLDEFYETLHRLHSGKRANNDASSTSEKMAKISRTDNDDSSSSNASSFFAHLTSMMKNK